MKKLYLLLLFFTTFIYAQEPFITTWQVQGGDLTIEIPVIGNESNYQIDFGDGTVLSNQTGQCSHTYTSPGIYTVIMSGNIERISFYDSSNSNQDKLKTVEQWGDNQWSSMARAFYGCSNLIINATDAPDLSQVTSMREMFMYATSFNQSINNWDVSNITLMEGMFSFALEFNQPLNNWDVSNVIDMDNMFDGAYAFNQSINNWDVSNVTSMSYMFREAYAFNHPLNAWDVSNVTNMREMFRAATSFNQSLDSWDVSNVTAMYAMFYEATAFNQPINNWNVSNVENMEYMFYRATAFNSPLNDWDVASVYTMYLMFAEATSFNQPLNDWDVSNVESIIGMFASATSFNQPLPDWNINASILSMFEGATSFNQDLSNWDFTIIWAIGDFVANSGMDTTNYDKLLLRFAQQGMSDVYFEPAGLQYCDSAVRNYLVTELGWYIDGDSQAQECIGNSISGTVLLDEDANGCDANDVAAANFLVSAGNGSFNYSTLPSADGAYSLNVQDDAYTVSLLNVPSYYTVNPATAPVIFTGFGNTENLNFCLTANQAIQDLSITVLPLDEARPGFESNYQLVVKNMGTQTVVSASVSLSFDNALQTFVNATPAPASTTTNEITFTVSGLQPFESALIDVTMETYTPPTVNGGEVAIFTATVTPNANDYTPADNSFELAQIVVNSYDPNDKRVLQGDAIFIEEADEYLDYIIRFQNTGSASAITVRIEDELHEKLDWTTLTPVSASHNYRVEITDGNHVEFIFDNINLPHQAADDEGSNGFIAYKIKPVATAEIGDIISGNASIFFDYNLPIITNNVSTEIVEELGVTDNHFNNQVTVYPNPVKNVLHLMPAESVQLEEVKIINLQGRELITVKSGFETLNVESLSQGVYLLVIKTSRGNLQQKLVKS